MPAANVPEPQPLNVTVPVGVPALLVTVAVNVTDCPNTLAGCDDTTDVDVFAFDTVSVLLALLVSKLPCAGYVAVNECEGALGVVNVMTADPLTSGYSTGAPPSTMSEML